METMNQPSKQTELLRAIQQKDSYNKFCVDCNKNESTHCSVTFGILICEECAGKHLELLGMELSYVKPLYQDVWDTFQIKLLENGGNKKFWDFIKQYNMELKDINAKFNSNPIKYYKKRLFALAQGVEFNQEQPPRNAEEILNRGVDGAKNLGKKAGEGIMKFGGLVGEKFEQSGVKEKFKGLFKKSND
ncbi:UNKNOWN [Stylonychia lemnae]|uniref:Arf-GAP domain-containing protein n=1 Tax=Stylonychia lemnae TaxID=5949 RepID=A0A078AQD8_STYLE|nr:UNKNOWN [Stylonychia lemnae]|eukprot:CDW84635.1 UNKNOWN [Stylonychia lemnae]